MGSQTLLTIGELARRANVSTSMLRFYERSGLLRPANRTASGYRVYGADAQAALLFIHRAQRLGFSLTDIKLFLHERSARTVKGASVAGIAERRFLDIERRLTELLVLRHELEVFLDDLASRHAGSTTAGTLYRNLVDHVCGHDGRSPRRASIDNLIARLGCAMAKVERNKLFSGLRGQHVHIWREGDGYAVLIPSRAAEVEAALRLVAAGESDCGSHDAPTITETSEGLLFSAQGPNAFLFAQLFLALEATEP